MASRSGCAQMVQRLGMAEGPSAEPRAGPSAMPSHRPAFCFVGHGPPYASGGFAKDHRPVRRPISRACGSFQLASLVRASP